MKKIIDLNIKIFADGADFDYISKLNRLDYIKGFTTNPTLIKQSGVSDYKSFADKILNIVKTKPISFEVFSDGIEEIEIEAEKISKWGKNVNVKIPIANTNNQSTSKIISNLTKKGIICNVTAIFTLKQIENLLENINESSHLILSIFAGRIADTGINPFELFKKAKKLTADYPNIELLWASTRQIYNIFEAAECGADIITVPYQLIKKFNLVGKNLEDYSLETIKDFFNDAKLINFDN